MIMLLSKKISEFKEFHKITDDIDQEFKLDDGGSLWVKWDGGYKILTRKNPNKFLTLTTMKYTNKYEANLLRSLKLIPPKPLPKAEAPKTPIDLQTQINTFKTFHNIENIPPLEIYNNTLSVEWNDLWIPVSEKHKNKPLAVSTLRRKFGESLVRHLGITIEPRKKQPVIKKTNQPFTPTQPQQPRAQVPMEELALLELPNSVGTYLKSFEMIIPPNYNDPLAFLNKVKPIILEQITNQLAELGGIKYGLGFEILLRKDNIKAPVYTDPPARFYSKQYAILNTDEIQLGERFAHLIESIEKLIQNGSGWTVDSLMTLWLDIAKYQPLKGGSYIELPKALKDKKAIVNVKNTDDCCLRWALRSALFPVEAHNDRPSSYPEEDGLNFEGIVSPTPISQLEKVEKKNNIAINAYGYGGGKVIIHRISNQPPEVRRINLMIIEEEEKKEEGFHTHYTWIKNMSRLLFNQTKSKYKIYFCERCLYSYTRQDLLDHHIIDCKGINERAITIEMPKEGKNTVKFKNHKNQLKAPWVIYADFEANTTKIEGPMNNPQQSSTQRTQLHEACGFAFRAVRSDGKSIGPIGYRGPNTVKVFLEKLQECEKIIRESLEQRQKGVHLTKDETIKHNAATTCWICKEDNFGEANKKKVCMAQQAWCLSCAHKILGHKSIPFEKASEEFKKSTKCGYCKSEFSQTYKVRDHDHITGKYRGAAHSNCNLKLRINPKEINIPVVFHNLRGYDSHLIMQHIGEMEQEITCIPNNLEKYISFSLGKLRFIDSFQFMLASLSKLVESTDKKALKFTKTGRTDQEFELLRRKGVYPYEYMDSWERFEEKQLPSIYNFYSKLTDEGITKEDYEHAQKVWEVFGCRNMGDYHDLYLATDVNLLADVFENFREVCLDNYELDPAHYYTSPGLSWDALLKSTKVELELLTDYDMHLMIEKGLRGGISMVSKRYAKANNPLVAGYDPSSKKTYILYLDANNLYGWAMVQHLPTGGFKWDENVNTSEYLENVLQLKPTAERGIILEVDLEYPKEFHDKHNDYPLAPESLVVQKEWLSEYQNDIIGESSLKVKKLAPNLNDKTKYVLHYRNLQQYIKEGMRVKKIHRAISFDQSDWMAAYINKNTKLRKQAKSDFEKDFFKLMNNSVFGKTMENLRRRINIQLIKGESDAKKLAKLIAKPSYAGRKTFSNNLTAIHMHKDKLKLNRPIYVGMCILDLSKILMYDFYYNELKKQYGDNCHLLYSDTDSLLLYIETEDIYKDMQQNAETYDTSNFNKKHYLYDETNKKVLGKMKDECGGTPIKEYVGLRPKMYSIITENQSIKKAKGVKKYVIKKEITHENYKQSLFNKETFRHEMNMLRSYDHQIYSIHMNKISLSPLDTKRWIANDGINTLAYGHHRIPLGGN